MGSVLIRVCACVEKASSFIAARVGSERAACSLFCQDLVPPWVGHPGAVVLLISKRSVLTKSSVDGSL